MSGWQPIQPSEKLHSSYDRYEILLNDKGEGLATLEQFKVNPTVTYANTIYGRIGPIRGFENARKRAEQVLETGVVR